MDTLTALDTLKGIGTVDCDLWRRKIIRRHSSIGPLLCRRYKKIAKAQDHVAANRWLGNLPNELKLGRTGLYLDSSEEELRDYCRAKAHNIHLEIYDLHDKVGKRLTVSTIRSRLALAGLELPLPDDYRPEEVVPAFARACDAQWWFQQLRKQQWRGLEHFIRRHGGVSEKRDIYISDVTFHRRRSQRKRNATLLQRLEAENEEGQSFTLAELAELSPSNPAIRRAELMVRMRGFEEIAKASGKWRGVFFTLTCPSKYHASLHKGRPNPSYNGSTPLEAHEYLNSVWARTRAAWQRANIEGFGVRVVEPHHDGTPHWHLLLFIPSDQVALARSIFERYALAEDGDEKGAKKYRLKTVEIDPDQGSATGYIAKYVAKNIDGYNVGADHYGRDAIESAARIEAWASVWGIRQFQQIGGPSVTVWRELRRLEADSIDQQLLKAIARAADESDWSEFTRLMGGAVCPRKARPIRPMMLPCKEESRYGEAVKALRGLWFGAIAVVTRVHEWTIRLVEIAQEQAGPQYQAFGFGVSLSNAPPTGGATLEFCQ